ncbi:MAG TPA: hypothetical protein VKS79_03480, partial [Gemmataceae bacterium]|nr:hypothetical protein [Gemmataceae bacterium]
QSDGVLVHTEIIAKANFLTCWMDEIPIGAANGAKPESLAIPFFWRGHWKGMGRLLNNPDFGPPIRPLSNSQEKPANPPAPE